MDISHLEALQTRLSNERGHLANEKTEAGKELRKVWIAQIEKEISDEYKFLGIDPVSADIEQLSDDELFAELNA